MTEWLGGYCHVWKADADSVDADGVAAYTIETASHWVYFCDETWGWPAYDEDADTWSAGDAFDPAACVNLMKDSSGTEYDAAAIAGAADATALAVLEATYGALYGVILTPDVRSDDYRDENINSMNVDATVEASWYQPRLAGGSDADKNPPDPADILRI